MDSNPICQPSPTNKMKCSFLDYVQLLMISRAGQWNRTPSTSPLQPKKMKCYFLDYVQLLMISWACQWTWTPSTTCLQPKKWNAHILIMFPSDDWPGWSMDLNPIHHPSPAKKMKSSFLYYVQLLMLARLVNGLKPHLPPSPTNKMKSSFLDYIQLLMIGRAGWWTQTPSTTTLQSKNEILIFGLRSTPDDQPGWSMDSNPICHPSPAKKMKCSFLDYVQLPIIGLQVDGLKPHLASPLQLIKWNAHFWNMFNFWWSAWLLCGLKPHLPALSSQKNEMLLFGLRSTSDDWLG